MRVAELVEGLRLSQQEPAERGRLAVAQGCGVVHAEAVDIRKVQRQQAQCRAHAEEAREDRRDDERETQQPYR